MSSQDSRVIMTGVYSKLKTYLSAASAFQSRPLSEQFPNADPEEKIDWKIYDAAMNLTHSVLVFEPLKHDYRYRRFTVELILCEKGSKIVAYHYIEGDAHPHTLTDQCHNNLKEHIVNVESYITCNKSLTEIQKYAQEVINKYLWYSLFFNNCRDFTHRFKNAIQDKPEWEDRPLFNNKGFWSQIFKWSIKTIGWNLCASFNVGLFGVYPQYKYYLNSHYNFTRCIFTLSAAVLFLQEAHHSVLPTRRHLGFAFWFSEEEVNENRKEYKNYERNVGRAITAISMGMFSLAAWNMYHFVKKPHRAEPIWNPFKLKNTDIPVTNPSFHVSNVHGFTFVVLGTVMTYFV
eukprot:267736_1